MFQPNDKVGPYILIKSIGRGGFGEVWLAEKRTHIATTSFALKFPLHENVDVDAIKKEAATWVKASGHPNVLPIIEADIYDGQIVIVSEYAPDKSLKDWLKRNSGRAASIESAVKMMEGILAGLEHLHSKAITHRDLKPDNILLQGDTPRLADFGLARVLKTIQSTQNVAGTPLYMSPEAWRNIRTAQMDLWAAAVIFYQLLSGDVPFDGDNNYSLMFAIVNKEAKPLPEAIPKPLRDFITKALKKNLNERYQTANAMRMALQKVIQPKQTHIIPRPAPILENIPNPPPPRRRNTQPVAIPLQQQTQPVSEGAQQNFQPRPQSNPYPPPHKFPPTSYLPVLPEVPTRQPISAVRVSLAIVGIMIMILGVGIGIWGGVKLISDKLDTAMMPQSPDNIGTNQLTETKLDVGIFVQIPAGEFMMGSDKVSDEQPLHKVKISNGFEMSKYEVTQGQWQALMGSNPSNFTNANQPVENVSWNDVQEFIKKLNAKSKGYVYRLPTEAEWEYACRAGSPSDYAGNLDEMAWYGSNSGNKTHPVGEKKANAWGLHDMHGNVWEWCSDWYDGGYYAKSPAVDPKGPDTGSDRVSRGGGWNDHAAYCRSADRGNNSPDTRFYYYGFRLLRTYN